MHLVNLTGSVTLLSVDQADQQGSDGVQWKTLILRIRLDGTDGSEGAIQPFGKVKLVLPTTWESGRCPASPSPTEVDSEACADARKAFGQGGTMYAGSNVGISTLVAIGPTATTWDPNDGPPRVLGNAEVFPIGPGVAGELLLTFGVDRDVDLRQSALNYGDTTLLSLSAMAR